MVPEILFDDGLHRIQDTALCSKPYQCPRSNLKDKYLGADILLAACGPPDERLPAFHSGVKGYHASKYNGS